MFKVKSIEMGADYTHGGGNGAKPGIKCVVTLQVGPASYDTTAIALPRDAVKRVVKSALDEVQAMMAIDHDSVDVEGAPGKDPEVKPEPGIIYADKASTDEPL